MDSVKLQRTHGHPLTLVAGQSECKACRLPTKADHYYRCNTCEPGSTSRSFHKECISHCQQRLVLTLDPGKDHHHPLTIFPSNFCARFGEWFPIYACVQCDLMVHPHCLGLPRVIRVSCHEHRISRRLYLPPGTRFCGVCHFEVDPRYGAFFCTKGCSYAVHTECAKSENVWDGSELEDVPEDVEPYEVIGDNLIKHFSHDHYLRFVLNQDGDTTSRCQACNLLIQSDNLYTCDLCDFILHQECANFKRRRWHPRHPHPILKLLPAILLLDPCAVVIVTVVARILWLSSRNKTSIYCSINCLRIRILLSSLYLSDLFFESLSCTHKALKYIINRIHETWFKTEDEVLEL